MDDQGPLRDLGRIARREESEEDRRWDRWERLTDGTLGDGEEAELRALAAGSAEDEAAFEAFRPLGADFRARMVATLGPLVGAPVATRGAASPGPAAAEAPTSSLLEPVEAPEPVAGRREARAARPTSPGRLGPWFTGWRLGFLGSALTAAASLFLFLRPAVPPPLPAFTLSAIESGQAIERGTDPSQGTPTLLAGTRFTLAAQPDERVAPRSKLVARCFVTPSGAPSEKPRDAACTSSAPSDNGSLRISGTLPRDLPSGPATLWIVVAYAGQTPGPDAIARLSGGGPKLAPAWTAIPQPIEVRAPHLG